MVADETVVRPCFDGFAALVGTRAVPDGVAETPHGIDPLGVDLHQHCLERLSVSVNV